MAQDRFIYWQEQVPSAEQVGSALADYLGEFATKVTLEHDRWTAALVGMQSNPHRRVGPEVDGFNIGVVWDGSIERWLEVFVAENNIDVITRMADPATCALADGFTALAARIWQGRIESG